MLQAVGIERTYNRFGHDMAITIDLHPKTQKGIIRAATSGSAPFGRDRPLVLTLELVERDRKPIFLEEANYILFLGTDSKPIACIAF